jgi:hypothetical protein
MSKINDGGSAFPTDNHPLEKLHKGMSLRDWFAGQALAGLIAQSAGTATGSDKALGARWAYQMADAMLKAREGGDA